MVLLGNPIAAQTPGLYVGSVESTNTSFHLTVPEGAGPMVLATAHQAEGAPWFSYGEYEGTARAQDKASIVAWRKVKSTPGNFPLPASTKLSFSGGQAVLALPGKSISLKKQTLQDLVFSGMYAEEPFARGDILFASAGQSFICARRRPGGGVELIHFSKTEAPVVLILAGWQTRLTRFLTLDPNAGPRDGVGPLVHAKNRSFRIQFDGTRTPESDATLTVFREGKPLEEFTGNDLLHRWKRKDAPAETVESFGEFRRWTNAANPLGLWFKAEPGQDIENWIPVAGGQKLQWWNSSKDGGPADSALILPDKSRIQFMYEEQQ
jgi:hypothetical protein